MKKKLRRVMYSVISGFIFAGCLAITGCRQNNNVTKYKAEKIMKEALEEKYGKEFVIEEVKETTTMGTGLPISGHAYFSKVYIEDESEFFYVYVDKDGSNCRDDYFKLFIDASLKEYIYELMGEFEDIEIELNKINYEPDSGNWTQCDDYDKFLEDTETTIFANINLFVESSQEAANRSYEIYEFLSNHHVKTDLTFEFNGNKAYISTSAHEEKTKEEIIEKCTFFFDK